MRGWHVIRFFPKRFVRLLNHFPFGFKQLSKGFSFRNFGFWLVELTLLVLDTLGIGELYETVQDLLKWHIRQLNQEEKYLASKYFGNQLNINRIRIDAKANIGPRQQHFAYVSFYTINSWNPLPADVFLHELVHIWQYEKNGIIYMSRALLAQHGKRGYNYGGVEMLKKLKKRGWTLEKFNPEHQAEIVQDHFRIKNGYQALWGDGCEKDIEVYDWFVASLKK